MATYSPTFRANFHCYGDRAPRPWRARFAPPEPIEVTSKIIVKLGLFPCVGVDEGPAGDSRGSPRDSDRSDIRYRTSLWRRQAALRPMANRRRGTKSRRTAYFPVKRAFLPSRCAAIASSTSWLHSSSVRIASDNCRASRNPGARRV